jgi:hypothetical protein
MKYEVKDARFNSFCILINPQNLRYNMAHLPIANGAINDYVAIACRHYRLWHD